MESANRKWASFWISRVNDFTVCTFRQKCHFKHFKSTLIKIPSNYLSITIVTFNVYYIFFFLFSFLNTNGRHWLFIHLSKLWTNLSRIGVYCFIIKEYIPNIYNSILSEFLLHALKITSYMYINTALCKVRFQEHDSYTDVTIPMSVSGTLC